MRGESADVGGDLDLAAEIDPTFDHAEEPETRGLSADVGGDSESTEVEIESTPNHPEPLAEMHQDSGEAHGDSIEAGMKGVNIGFLSSWLNPVVRDLSPPTQIHPWLTPSSIFLFDLAPAVFRPLYLVSRHPPRSAVVGAELRDPTAFSPPISRLRILHPRLPFPINLALPPSRQVSFGDVLSMLHDALQEPISQMDFHRLKREDKTRVTRAFTARCLGEAFRSGVLPPQRRHREVAVRNHGAKFVDFLLGETIFEGLLPADPGQSLNSADLPTYRLVTAKS
ncbi:hypothetical protein C8R46DRAFT_1306409 [Mycena filopes]|nr:hypothetical protein C8R46DRAFT_1306409 [Mycena filopes]